ncbi:MULTISPECIES: hypothetical protein [unclassified Variovorax]|uniref:hypothetical protein n=1 Tax=unclassified Variovorax TaxID=663243 RepID=UPI001316698D|nr:MULTISPECIES: hypothetical protein [unclassified Variovorax]VTU42514.1 hypothetical protein H6P1_00210 [Variovorax sp. PBL-H6]VTU43877.1 hypothetical protein SRS16P1_00692 [Variovorax sp. SRS16]VTU43946.1 hypothetical protein E5P1_00685 [Variovorax sp. PBL-E5]
MHAEFHPGNISSGMALAVEHAEAGFHFEEGGCWAMAVALYERFTLLGAAPVLRYRADGFTHAWVEVDGVGYDHQGNLFSLPLGATVASAAEMADIAARFGVSTEDFEADKAWADQVVATASRLLAWRVTCDAS